MMCVALVACSLIFSVFAFRAGGFANSFGVAYIAVVFVVYIVLIGRTRKAMAEGPLHWRREGRSVVLVCPVDVVVLRVGVYVLGFLSSIVSAALWRVRGDESVFIISGLVIFGMFFAPYLLTTLRLGPVRRLVTLDKRGVRLAEIKGTTYSFSWKRRPRVVGGGAMEAVIESTKEQAVRYNMEDLPLSFRQLERLLATFSTRKDLRANLAGKRALPIVLDVLEPTGEELADGSWPWGSPPTTTTQAPRPISNP